MGEVISLIAVVNESTVVPDADFQRMTKACCEQLRRDVCPAWGWAVVPVASYFSRAAVPVGTPIVALRDKSDAAGAAGYHDEDEVGAEQAFVFAKDVLKYGSMLNGPDSVSAVLSHEIIELLGDPFCTRWEDGPRLAEGSMYAFELADPVQGHAYPISVDGVDVSVSNFILPAWFDGGRETGGDGLVDYLGACPGSFQLAPGGYMVVRGSRGEHPIFAAVPPSARALDKLKTLLGRAGRRQGGTKTSSDQPTA